jgi:pyruvate,orthophosphate dikinase
VETVQPELSGDFAKVMEWADKFRTMGVRVNCDTPQEAKVAVKFGCEGIGLCRTEHMFFDAGRIVAMREMILADSVEQRRRALDKLLPYQREDFVALFKEMAGRPVTIRLLDPPLHEFLPHADEAVAEVAAAAGVPMDQVRARSLKLVETNPMLGHRGCRLGITYPEIYEMQARAIFEAALVVFEKSGETVTPEVMIPLVVSSKELALIKKRIVAVAEAVAKERGKELHYEIGTMIELPRAALRAQEIAAHAHFFSFGTNDLTQMALGLSRDDAGSFLETYLSEEVFAADPFRSLDQDGVGELVKIAAERGRAARPNLQLGICGEHGGDPASIGFCHRLGLDYVSCSPYRVPIARLAAAQAALSDGTLGPQRDR